MKTTKEKLDFENLENSIANYQEKINQITSNKVEAEKLEQAIEYQQALLASIDDEKALDRALQDIKANQSKLELLTGREAPYLQQLDRITENLRLELQKASREYEKLCRNELSRVSSMLAQIFEPFFSNSFNAEQHFNQSNVYGFVLREIKFVTQNVEGVLASFSHTDSLISIAQLLINASDRFNSTGSILLPEHHDALKKFDPVLLPPR